MTLLDQRLCAWGGPFAALTLAAGLLLAGFVPPPPPTLSPDEIAAVYAANPNGIRAGMLLGLFSIIGYLALVGVVSAQMRRMQGGYALPAYLQLGAGCIGVLTVMFPLMLMAIAAYRPERDPALTQLINDVAWLIIIPAFPTFIAQFLAIAFGIWKDDKSHPVFPRWAAYFNIWVGLLFVPGGFAYFFKTGAFAWNGLLAFWVAASAFFAWLLLMPWLVLKAIAAEQATEKTK